MQSPSLWIMSLSSGDRYTFTPPSRLLVVSACLEHELLLEESGRGVLTIKAGASKHARSIASFAKEACEHVNLGLILDANVRYVLGVDGPYGIDLLGYYLPGAQQPVSDSAQKPGASPEETSPQPDDGEAESVPRKKLGKRKTADGAVEHESEGPARSRRRRESVEEADEPEEDDERRQTDESEEDEDSD